MPSTYSTNLKLELIATGEQSGTWGVSTNTNVGTLIEEAICGVASVAMSDATTTISIANGATSTARQVVLLLTGTLTAARDLVVPTIDKQYIVANNTTGGFAVTVKTTAGTGISVPNGQRRFLYVDSTNVEEAISSTGTLAANGNLSSTGTLSVTGASTLSGALTYGGITLTNSVTGTGSMVLSASPTLTGAPIVTVGDNAPAASGNMNTGVIIWSSSASRAVNIGVNNTAGYSWINAAFGNNSGISDELRIMTGTTARLTLNSAAATFSTAINYGGVTLTNSVTGTGSMVLSASPTLTGTLAAAAGTFSSTLGVTGALTYGGVTLTNSVTGTGSMVLSANPTFTGTLTATAGSFSSTLSAASLSLTTDLPITEGGTGASTAADARTNLGLGTISTQAASAVAITGGSITGITDLTVADGGTGASTAADARTNLGLSTMATQAASAVAITGGTSAGVTITGGSLTGVVVPFAGSTAPTGSLLCFGQAVNRTTYAALFAIIATAYGIGDGSTTFNVPDLRGRSIAGVDNMGGTAAGRITAAGSGITGTTLGASGGTETHTLITAEMPAHTHSVPAQITSGNDIGGGGAYLAAGLLNNGTSTSTGGGGAHQNTQPTMMINYIIYT